MKMTEQLEEKNNYKPLKLDDKMIYEIDINEMADEIVEDLLSHHKEMTFDNINISSIKALNEIKYILINEVMKKIIKLREYTQNTKQNK